MDYNYIGTYQTATLEPGIYKFEVWGANGGGDVSNGSRVGGMGGKTVAQLTFKVPTTIYVYVGGQGSFSISTTNAAGGYNGGGIAYNNSGNPSSNKAYYGGGGGASDIRVINNSINNRIIVAGGGGGGGGGDTVVSTTSTPGGHGGGLLGNAAANAINDIRIGGGGGTQTTGGAGGSYTSNFGGAGTFGVGGAGIQTTSNYYVSGGGGGGWYGGGGGGGGGPGGGGGSGYILTESSHKPANYFKEHPLYYFTEGYTAQYNTSGYTSNPDSSGNGYIRITKIGELVSEERQLDFLVRGTPEHVTLGPGKYKLECWGANGGNVKNIVQNCIGGYSTGILKIDVNTLFYVVVGGKGGSGPSSTKISGGYNGGGDHYRSTQSNTRQGNSGGGASDIRILSDSLYNRIIVAGGGGGGRDLGGSTINQDPFAGLGGGSSGTCGSNYNDSKREGQPGTQTAGGEAGVPNNSVVMYPGIFGRGGDWGPNGMWTGGAGGGGWYGGGAGGTDAMGGGGSGYILTESSHKPSGYFSQYAEYYLTDAFTGDLVEPGYIPNPDSSGNGYIRITKIGYEIPTNSFLKDVCINARPVKYIRDYLGFGQITPGIGTIHADSHWNGVRIYNENGEDISSFATSKLSPGSVNSTVGLLRDPIKPTNWEKSGCRATSDSWSFGYTGEPQSLTLSEGTYFIHCWGANGGTAGENTGTVAGKGGYSRGIITLATSTTLYLCVGGVGKSNLAASGGYNGGGGITGVHTNIIYYTGGGGATHIATRNGILSSLAGYRSDIKIVAGGGGGQGNLTGSGGSGGGVTGQDGQGISVNIGKGGTQTAAGVYPGGIDSEPGGFGFGSGGPIGTVGGAGGGGWYGGSFGTRNDGGGAGGSGYIGGVSQGLTVQPTEPGYIPNPASTGYGYLQIMKLHPDIYQEITLDKVRLLSRINVHHYGEDERVYLYHKLDVSVDGINWETIFDSTKSGIQQERPISEGGKDYYLIPENKIVITTDDKLLARSIIDG